MNFKTFVIAAAVLAGLLFYYFSCNRCHDCREPMRPCPKRPNCVSSREHMIAPLPYASIDTLKKIVLRYPKARIVAETPTYLRVEFRSKTFSFVDDAEFLLNPETNVIEVRSAARCGYSDLGVNRKRLEEIREQLS